MPFDPDKLRQSGQQTDWGEPPPPGSYTAELTNSGAFTSKAGEDWCKFTFRIADGNQAGHEWDLIQTLEDKPALSITYRQLKAIGVDLDGVASLDELEGAISAYEGRRYLVEVSRNGQYTNTNIKGEDTQTALPIAAGARTAPDVPIDRTDLGPPNGTDPADEDIPF